MIQLITFYLLDFFLAFEPFDQFKLSLIFIPSVSFYLSFKVFEHILRNTINMSEFFKKI